MARLMSVMTCQTVNDNEKQRGARREILDGNSMNVLMKNIN